MKKLGSGTHSTVSNYRKETGNATQMGKKAHLELARSGLFVSEIADAERERNFCISVLAKEIWKIQGMNVIIL